MAIGRPSKYCNEIVELAKDYLVNFESYGDVVPTIAGLACEIGISRETVYAWMADADKQDFSDIAKQLMSHQERKLTNGSLANQLNPMIAKLMLSKHGYSEKQDINHQSSDGSMTPKAFSKADYEAANKTLADDMEGLD